MMQTRGSRRQYARKMAARKEAKRELRKNETLRYPCFEIFNYSRDIRLNALHLKWHLETRNWKRGDELKKIHQADLISEDSPFLQLNNPEASILFYPIFAAAINVFAVGQECVFLTLAPARFCMSLDDAKRFDLKKRLLPWVRQTLAGLHYVGFVDIACYSNYMLDGRPGRTLSFHVHVVVRGSTRRELETLVARINSTNSAFVPRKKAAHFERITPGTIHRLASYMCKGPTGDYRVAAHTVPDYDEKGRLFKRAVGGHRQWKRQFASPGIQLSVRDAVRHLHLDDLLFAGGAGRLTVEQILKHTRSGMPHSMRRHREKSFSGQLPDRPRYNDECAWTADYTYVLEKDRDRRDLGHPWKFDPVAAELAKREEITRRHSSTYFADLGEDWETS